MVEPVFDAHTHAFPDALAPAAMKQLVAEALWMPVRPAYDGTLAGLLASMDRAGIRQSVVCSVATKPSQVPKITDWSAKIASDRILPFPSIHPGFPEPEREAERIARLGLKGLKFHPQYMQCAADDPRAVRIASAAERAGLAFVLHAGYDLAYPKEDLGAPVRIRRLHEQVPNLRLLAAHLGGWQRWEEALEHVAGRPIYLDTSFCFGQCPAALLAQILARHPPEYLLFGSDAPWSDQATDLAAFRELKLPAGAQRRALWENGRRFAGLDPAASQGRA